jgi:hypothetical protein
MRVEMSEGLIYVALLTGTVGSGFLIYGIKQKEPFALIIGVLLNVMPFGITDPWVLLGLSIVVVWGGLWLKRLM